MENGNHGNILMTVRENIGTRHTHAAVEEKIDKMFGYVKKFIIRNSKKDFLRMSNWSGFFNSTSVDVTESYGSATAFALTCTRLMVHLLYSHAVKDKKMPCCER